MKRKTTGGAHNAENKKSRVETGIYVVRVGPLSNQAIGKSVGATAGEVAKTVAHIQKNGQSPEEYNRTIRYEQIPLPEGVCDAAAYAAGYLGGLTYVRSPGNTEKFYAFPASLVEGFMLDDEFEPDEIIGSDDEDDDDDDDESVESSSSEEEESVSDDEEAGSFLESGHTSESE